MKVFISSLITGMEEHRAAAREAVETLGYDAVTAETFAAKPQTPQVACLDGVRQSGLILLLLGAEYGVKQKSGLSATHEEYRDAKGNRPVMAFVRSNITPDPAQAAFIKEVESWETGLFRGNFSTPHELRTQITRAIHAWQLSNATGPLDTKALSIAALTAASAEVKKHQQSHPALILAVAVGPAQLVLRPSEMENPRLSKELLEKALFGQFPIFSHAYGNETDVEGNCLVIQQARGVRTVQLDPEGNLLFRLELERDNGFALIKEALEQQLLNSLGYAAMVLDRIDPTQKLTHVSLAVALAGANYIIIRTQAEHNASPNSYQMSGGWGREENNPVQLQPAHRPRAALTHEVETLAEDLVILLRRRKNG